MTRYCVAFLGLLISTGVMAQQTDCVTSPNGNGVGWQMNCDTRQPNRSGGAYGAMAQGLDAVRRNMEINAQLQAQQQQYEQMEALRRQNAELLELQRKQIELMQQQQGNLSATRP